MTMDKRMREWAMRQARNTASKCETISKMNSNDECLIKRGDLEILISCAWSLADKYEKEFD